MCLTLPRQIISVQPPNAFVQAGVRKRRVRIDGLGKVKPGQWLLVQADVAVKRITRREAQGILNLFEAA